MTPATGVKRAMGRSGCAWKARGLETYCVESMRRSIVESAGMNKTSFEIGRLGCPATVDPGRQTRFCPPSDLEAHVSAMVYVVEHASQRQRLVVNA